MPTISLTELYRFSLRNFDIPAVISLNTSTPLYITAVPTWIADAPAIIISTAPLQSVTPPTPMIGIFTAALTWYTVLTASEWRAGPERPPYTPPRIGEAASTSIAMPQAVLIAVRAFAPAASAAFAIS